MPSYSGLLKAIRDGQVEQLQLLPREDEVQVHFKDGRQGRVPVFSNDQQILRTLRYTRSTAIWPGFIKILSEPIQVIPRHQLNQ